ncbi:A-kinase anchor protein 9 isoform X3 [Petromyzon marinus]|uniref:A-kinase anchor protein 9 isoform X3 n=1 Tax=Petromyzon marinus TaxID=7757 RepID=A0AAJ7TH19_PETMA|nr:A-kinase anchor protein 9 isoform X3 [Petromyzon marinus]
MEDEKERQRLLQAGKARLAAFQQQRREHQQEGGGSVEEEEEEKEGSERPTTRRNKKRSGKGGGAAPTAEREARGKQPHGAHTLRSGDSVSQQQTYVFKVSSSPEEALSGPEDEETQSSESVTEPSSPNELRTHRPRRSPAKGTRQQQQHGQVAEQLSPLSTGGSPSPQSPRHNARPPAGIAPPLQRVHTTSPPMFVAVAEDTVDGTEVKGQPFLQKDNIETQLSEEQVKEVHAAIQQRDAIITQLSANLQQAVRSRDAVQHEALTLSTTVHGLQQQLLEASETLKKSRHGNLAAELQQAHEQISLYQETINEQGHAMQEHAARAAHHEQQLALIRTKLEDSEKTLKEKDVVLTGCKESIKEKENLIGELSGRMNEKEKNIIELSKKMREREDALAQLVQRVEVSEQNNAKLQETLQLTERDGEKMRNELSTIKQREMKTSSEIKTLMGTMEQMQKQHQGSSEAELMQRIEAELQRKLDRLRTEMDETHGLQIAQMKQQMREQHKREIEELNTIHRSELDKMSSIPVSHMVDEEQVDLLNSAINELNIKLRESHVQRDQLKQEYARREEEYKNEVSGVERRHEQKVLELRYQLSQAHEQVQNLSNKHTAGEQHSKEVELLTAALKELRAQVAEMNAAKMELQSKYEQEVMNYQIKLEMMEREKDAVLDRMAESQEAELERLRTELMFSHEEELRALKDTLAKKHLQEQDTLKVKQKQQVDHLQSEMDTKNAAIRAKCHELSAEKAGLLVEVSTMKSDIENLKKGQGDDEDMIKQIEMLKAEVGTLRSVQKDLHERELQMKELQAANKQVIAAREKLEQQLADLQKAVPQRNDVDILSPTDLEESSSRIPALVEQCSMLEKQLRALKKINETAKQTEYQLREELEKQHNTFVFSERNFEVNMQELREEHEQVLKEKSLIEVKLEVQMDEVKTLKSELLQITLSAVDTCATESGGMVVVESRKSQDLSATFVEKDSVELMEKMQVVERERDHLVEEKALLLRMIEDHDTEVASLKAQHKTELTKLEETFCTEKQQEIIGIRQALEAEHKQNMNQLQVRQETLLREKEEALHAAFLNQTQEIQAEHALQREATRIVLTQMHAAQQELLLEEPGPAAQGTPVVVAAHGSGSTRADGPLEPPTAEGHTHESPAREGQALDTTLTIASTMLTTAGPSNMQMLTDSHQQRVSVPGGGEEEGKRHQEVVELRTSVRLLEEELAELRGCAQQQRLEKSALEQEFLELRVCKEEEVDRLRAQLEGSRASRQELSELKTQLQARCGRLAELESVRQEQGALLAQLGAAQEETERHARDKQILQQELQRLRSHGLLAESTLKVVPHQAAILSLGPPCTAASPSMDDDLQEAMTSIPEDRKEMALPVNSEVSDSTLDLAVASGIEGPTLSLIEGEPRTQPEVNMGHRDDWDKTWQRQLELQHQQQLLALRAQLEYEQQEAMEKLMLQHQDELLLHTAKVIVDMSVQVAVHQEAERLAATEEAWKVQSHGSLQAEKQDEPDRSETPLRTAGKEMDLLSTAVEEQKAEVSGASEAESGDSGVARSVSQALHDATFRFPKEDKALLEEVFKEHVNMVKHLKSECGRLKDQCLKLQEQLVSELDSLCTSLNETHQRDMENVRALLTVEHQKEAASLKEAHSKDLDDLRSSLKEQHKYEVEKVMVAVKEAQHMELQSLRSFLGEMQDRRQLGENVLWPHGAVYCSSEEYTSVEALCAGLVKQHAGEMEKLKREQKELLQELQESFNQKLANLQVAHAAETDAQSALEVAALKEAQEEEVKALTQQLEAQCEKHVCKAVQKLRGEHREELEALLVAHEEELKEQAEKLGRQHSQALQKAVGGLRSENAALAAHSTQLQQAHQAERAAMQQEFEQRLEHVRAQLHDGTQAEQRRVKQNERSQEDLMHVQAQLECKQEAMDRMSEELTRVQEELKLNQVEMEQNQVDLEHVQEKLMHVQAELERKQVEQERMQAELERTKRETEHKQEEMEHVQAEAARREAQLVAEWTEKLYKESGQQESVQQLRKELDTLQEKLHSRSSELEQLLQRRERENEEGGNLLGLMRTDLDRLQSERANTVRANEHLLHVLSEVVRRVLSSEESIARRVSALMAPAPEHAGTSAQVPAGSVLDVEEGVASSASPRTLSGYRIPVEGADEGEWHEGQMDETSSARSAATDEGLELSQRLSESIFSGPELETAGEELVLGSSARLQAATSRLLDLLAELSRQLEQARAAETELVSECSRRTHDAAGLAERLAHEAKAREQLALELHKAEGLLEGYVAEKLSLQTALQEREASERALAGSLEAARGRLTELETEQQQLDEERRLLERQRHAMAASATGAQMVSVGPGDGSAPPGLLHETEKMAQEKRRVEQQAERGAQELHGRLRALEVALDEALVRNAELEKERHAEASDLQQQVLALEKQLKHHRQFMEEQAADREHEREEFQQEIKRLEGQLKQQNKATPAERASREIQGLQDQVEGLEEAVRVRRAREAELLREHSEQRSALSDRAEEAERQAQRATAQLQQQLLSLQQARDDLAQDNEALQQQQYAQLTRISALQAEVDEHRHRSTTPAPPGAVSMSSTDAATLRHQLQEEKEANERKSKEITHLEEQLEQFREELLNKSEETGQLQMQLEIQRKQAGHATQLQQGNTHMKKVELSEAEDGGGDRRTGKKEQVHLSLPDALLQEKNAEIDQLTLQVQQLTHALQAAPPSQALQDENEELRAEVRCLRSDVDRLRRQHEEELERTHEVIARMQRELPHAEATLRAPQPHADSLLSEMEQHSLEALAGDQPGQSQAQPSGGPCTPEEQLADNANEQEKKQVLEEALRKLEALKETYEVVVEEHRLLKLQLAERDNDKSALTEQLGELQRTVAFQAAAEEEKAAAQHDAAEALQAQVQQLLKQLEEQQQLVERQAEARTHRQQEISATAAEEKRQLEEELAKVRSELGVVSMSMEEQTLALAALSAQMESSTHLADARTAEAAGLAERLQEEGAAMAELRQQTEELRATITEKEDSVQQLSGECERLQQELKRQIEEVTSLTVSSRPASTRPAGTQTEAGENVTEEGECSDRSSSLASESSSLGLGMASKAGAMVEAHSSVERMRFPVSPSASTLGGSTLSPLTLSHHISLPGESEYESLSCNLKRELDMADHLDSRLVAHLQHQQLQAFGSDERSSERDSPSVFEASSLSEPALSTPLQDILTVLHWESEKVLALSENTQRPAREPLEGADAQQGAGTGPGVTSTWLQEKRVLLQNIAALKELLAQVSKQPGHEDAAESDWRGEFIRALLATFDAERRMLLVSSAAQPPLGHAPTHGTPAQQLLQLVSNMERMETSVLAGLEAAERASLLSELGTLRSEGRVAALQHQEEAHRLQADMASQQDQSAVSTGALKRQVELLECKLQQEQAVGAELQTELGMERSHGATLQREAAHERERAATLEGQLARLQAELDSAVGTWHQHAAQAQALLAELQEKEGEISRLREALSASRVGLAQERRSGADAQPCGLESQGDAGTAFTQLHVALEKATAHSTQLSSTLEQEREAAVRHQRDLEAERNSLKLRLTQLQAALAAEKQHVGELQVALTAELDQREKAPSGSVARAVDDLCSGDSGEERAAAPERVLVEEREVAAHHERGLREEVEGLKADVAHAGRELEQERRECKQLRRVVQELQAQLEEAAEALRQEKQLSARTLASVRAAKEEQRSVQERCRLEHVVHIEQQEQELRRARQRLLELEECCRREQQMVLELRQTVTSQRSMGSSPPTLPPVSLQGFAGTSLENTMQRLQLLVLRVHELVTRIGNRLMVLLGDGSDEELEQMQRSLNDLSNELRQMQSTLPGSTKGTGRVSLELSERLLQQNSELTGLVSLLTQEKEDLRSALTCLQQDARRQQQQRGVALGVTESQRLAEWLKEKLSLQAALQESETEVTRLRAQQQREALRRGSPQPDVSNSKMQHLYGRYLKAESFRKALVYQKRYLLLLLGGFRDCEQATLALIARMGAFPSQTDTRPPGAHSRAFTRFRSAVRVVIAISRLRFMVRKWQRATRSHSPMDRGGGSASDGSVRAESPRLLSTSSAINSPPTRDRPHAASSRSTRQQAASSPLAQHMSLSPAHVTYTSQTQDPERSLTDYIGRLEALQHRLGGLQPGSPSSRYRLSSRR